MQRPRQKIVVLRRQRFLVMQESSFKRASKMYKSDYVKAIKIQKFLLTLLGIWPKRNSRIVYKIYGFITTFCLPPAFILPSLFELSLDIEYAGEGSYYLFCSITVVSYTIKLIVFCVNKKIFQNILNHLSQPIFNSYEDQFDVYMLKAIQFTSRVRKLVYYPCILFIIFLVTFPTFDQRNKRSLPFVMPLDMDKISTWMYFCIYIMEVIAAAVCACTNATLDSLACSLIALGTIQLEILGGKLRNLRATAESARTSEKFGQYDYVLMEKLKNNVKHHIAIIEYIRKIEEMYSYTFLIQFLTSLVVIGVTTFSVIIIPKNDVLFGAAISFFVAAMVEVSMYCISGDELTIQSLKVCDACYASEWNNFSPKIQNMIFIIMERSKKPLVLTAKEFSNLSRHSLVTICKTSYSYFALLRQMYEL